MNTSEAAHRPSDIEDQYCGEARGSDGYQFWTTSLEDEESLDIREQVAAGMTDKKVVTEPRRKVFGAGAFRRTAIRLALMILITGLLLIGYFVFTYVQVLGAVGDDQAQDADIAIVLGAAQYNGAPSYVLQERLDHAYNLYDAGKVERIFVTGAVAKGDVKSEGLVGLEHLLAKGVPEEDITLIPEGTNSWQQLSASAAQIETLRMDSVLLVSDGYHNYRLLAIADELGIEAYVSPSAVASTTMNVVRESAAVSIGRITGYRRLSAFTE